MNDRVTDYITNLKMTGIRVRGLKVNLTDISSNMSFCDLEFLILNDAGAINMQNILVNFSKVISITSFRVYGDIHLNNYGIL